MVLSMGFLGWGGEGEGEGVGEGGVALQAPGRLPLRSGNRVLRWGPPSAATDGHRSQGRSPKK